MTNDSNAWEVVVIGAGAAGLLAAASASKRGRRVLLLEKNRKLGVKILMSGGTRCNITHHCRPLEIASAFGPQGKFLHSALAALPPDEVIRMIEAEGVATKIESTGKIFPVSDSAVDVRDALVRIAQQSGVHIRPEHPVDSIDSITGSSTNNRLKFSVKTPTTSFQCESLIITTGGKSYPGCGTTGDGYAWAEGFGHQIVKTVPALTPITCNQSWVNELKGVTLEDTKLAVIESKLAKGDDSASWKNALSTQRGPLLFTHFGFSGPAVLNVSRAITRRESVGGLSILCDYLPFSTTDELREQIRGSSGKLVVSTPLAKVLPKRLVESLLHQTGIPPQTKIAELRKSELTQLVRQIKQCRLPISGTLGFKKAEVTAGGIDLSQVRSKTMESKLVDGLFFAGEILDLDGPIGGFNFQAAFSTGWLAGLNA